jgi:hypothetical protein
MSLMGQISPAFRQTGIEPYNSGPIPAALWLEWSRSRSHKLIDEALNATTRLVGRPFRGDIKCSESRGFSP